MNDGRIDRLLKSEPEVIVQDDVSPSTEPEDAADLPAPATEQADAVSAATTTSDEEKTAVFEGTQPVSKQTKTKRVHVNFQ